MLKFQKKTDLIDFGLSDSIIESYQQEIKRGEKKQIRWNRFLWGIIFITLLFILAFIPYAFLRFAVKESLKDSIIGGLSCCFYCVVGGALFCEIVFHTHPIDDFIWWILDLLNPIRNNITNNCSHIDVKKKLNDYQSYCSLIIKEYPKLDEFDFDINAYTNMLFEEIIQNLIFIIQKNNNEHSKKWWKELDPYEFEEQTAIWFSKLGYKARVTKKAGDGGVDVILTKENEKSYVQCKHYNHRITLPYVRDFYGAMMANNISKGFIVCLDKGLTSEAMFFAKKVGIQIIMLNDLVEDELQEETIPLKNNTYFQIGEQIIVREIFESGSEAFIYSKSISFKDYKYAIVSSLQELSKTTHYSYTRNVYFILCTNNYDLWNKYRITLS